MDTRHSPVALAFSASVTLLPPWYCVCHVSKSVLLSTPSPLPLTGSATRQVFRPLFTLGPPTLSIASCVQGREATIYMVVTVT